jgi:hypothetical protein
MDAPHSVWLMLREDDERQVATIVRDLAAEFGAPVFRPHLTLVEDNGTAPADLAQRVRGLALAAPRFAADIAGIGASTLYFRSLYARFPAEGPVRALKQRAIETIAMTPLAEFMPHVSLLYGIADTAEKRAAIARLEPRLTGMRLNFDAVAMVESAKSIPIADWRVAARYPLGGAPSP